MPTVIRFDKDHRLEVKEAPTDIRGLLDTIPDSPVPTLELTQKDGESVWVNVRAIREFSGRGERTTVAHFG